MKLLKVKTQPIQESKRKTAHLYIFPTQESIVENLLQRRERPYKNWYTLIPQILKKAGLTEKEIKEVDASWSQKCGCSCGCSPGFRLKGYTEKDVWADVDMSNKTN